MKKILCIAFLGLLIFASQVFAIDLQIGGDIDCILKKDIVLSLPDGEDVKADLSAQFYDVAAIFKFGDILKVTPMIGINAASIEVEEIDGYKETVNTGIGWNVGAEAQLDVLKNELADLSLIGAYRFSRTDIDEFEENGTVTENLLDSQVTLYQYEIGAIVSKDLKEITNLPIRPYVGVAYSDLVGSAKINQHPYWYSSRVEKYKTGINADKNVGLRLGIKTEPVSNLLIDLDVKLVDETTVGGKITYKF